MRGAVKKAISLFLVVSLLFSLSAEVFADTLTLPAALREIGEEAFYGDASLDEVVIPDGTETIGPRAFADSGLKRILIPDSVNGIADDAFAGLPEDFTIWAAKYSYACEHALSHGYLWHDTTGDGLEDALTMLEEIEYEEPAAVTIDEMRFERIPTEGIKDPQELALINAYNDSQAELETLNAQMIQHRDSLLSISEEFSGFMADNDFAVSEDSLSYNTGDLSYSVPTEVTAFLGADAEILSSETTPDGAVLLEVRAGDSTVYLRADENGISFAGQDSASGADLSDIASFYAAGRNTVLERLESMRRIMNMLNDLLNATNTILNVMTNTQEAMQSHMGNAYKNATELKTNYGSRYLPQYTTARTNYLQSTKTLNNLRLVGKTFSGLNLFTNLYALTGQLNDFYYLSDVNGHQHPTDLESQNTEALILCQQLEDDLIRCVELKMAQMGLTLFQIVDGIACIFTKISAIAGPAGWTAEVVTFVSLNALRASVRALIIFASGRLLDDNVSALMASVKDIDGVLHYELSGVVTDRDTHEPIEGVWVSCTADGHDPIEVRTDSKGAFRLEPLAQTVSLRLHKDGYDDPPIALYTLTYDKPVSKKLEMKPVDRLLSGYVYNSVTGAPIMGTQVSLSAAEGSFTSYTDSSGRYSFINPPVGTVKLSFSSPLCVAMQPVSVVIPKTGDLQFDVRLRPNDTTKPVDGTGFSEDFWQWCLDRFDTNQLIGFDPKGGQIWDKDGVLDQGELKVVTNIDCGGKGFASLNGLQNFRNLEYLDCSGNQLTSLSVSGLPMLRYLDCKDNQLTSLSLSGCNALESVNCYNNRLTDLSVSGFGALSFLQCSDNLLTHLDCSNNSMLEELWCYQNPLTRLDCSDCTALTQMGFDNGCQLESLDCAGCTALGPLDFSLFHIESLDLSGCTALTELSCRNALMQELNITGCTALRELDCSSNQLSSLNCSGCAALTELNCSHNLLTSLNVSGCTSLTDLNFGYNLMTGFDGTALPALTELACGNNKLTSLRVAGNSALKNLYCENNELESLDCSGCTSLHNHYYVGNPQLRAISFSGCTGLTFVDLQDCVRELDLSGCTGLTGLDLSHHGLERLNLSGCVNLTGLDCYGNQLTSIDLSGCSALPKIECSSNKLTALDLSDCTALQHLLCSNNSLTSLDLSGHTALMSLACTNNELESLDCSGCTSLQNHYYVGNPQLRTINFSGCTALTFVDLQDCVTDLNLSGCTGLTGLNFDYMGLEKLNLTGCTGLTGLSCIGNRLTTLNLSGCRSLPYFNCSSNRLTSLTLSGCTALSGFTCTGNALKSINISGCPGLTRDKVECDPGVEVIGG